MEKDKDHLNSLTQLQKAQEDDKDCRDKAREQDSFVLEPDGQWEPNVARAIDSARRPRYTFDFTSSAIELVMVDIEDMDFGVNVRPNGGGADKDTAELYEGMVRSIENMSDASGIYRNSCRRVIRRGFDAWLVRNKYTDDFCFDQDLCVEAIPNAINRVWTSCDGVKPDNSDSSWTFILESLSPEEYKERYPDGGMQSIDDCTDNEFNEYNSRDVITIAHKFYLKHKKAKVALMSNGQVFEMDDKFMQVVDEMMQQGIAVVKWKEAKLPKFYHRIMDGAGWLTDERETVFSSNPVVTVYGNFEIVGHSSSRRYSGMVEKLMDFNRVLNYAKSREIEEGALAPKDFFWMTKKQASGNMEKLSKLNVSNDPIQFFTPDDEFPSPPVRSGGAQINPHLTQLSADMQMGISTQSNVNNAMNGQYAGRMSEDALRMQIDRGVGSTRKWVNAVANGIRRTGELLVQAIPIVYDTKRIFTITNIDGTMEDVTLNDEIFDVQTNSVVKLNDLAKGKYAVFCDVGPAFANRLEASRDAMIALAGVNPMYAQMGADLMAKSVDAPMMDVLSKRMRQSMLQQGLIPFAEMTDEEKQAAMQQAQNQQPDANTLLAMAEMEKAKADQMDAATKQADSQVKAFDAETKRMKVMVEAQQAGAKIDNTNADTMNKQVDAALKVSGRQQ